MATTNTVATVAPLAAVNAHADTVCPLAGTFAACGRQLASHYVASARTEGDASSAALMTRLLGL